MKDVARKVIGHVRFSLLDPEYLNLVEKENELKPFIPVSIGHIRIHIQVVMVVSRVRGHALGITHVTCYDTTISLLLSVVCILIIMLSDGRVPPQIRLLSEAWRSHALQDKDSNNPQLRARAGTLPHDALARKLARSQGYTGED